MTTRDRSGCRSVVEKSSILETSPRTFRISTCSPTRKGLVKMIVRPATRLPSTPCSAKPTPRPATPMPATSGAIWKPNLASATTQAKRTTTTLTARTMSFRRGGSIALFSSPVIGEATDPAGGDRADGQDGEGPQHRESVTDQKIED